MSQHTVWSCRLILYAVVARAHDVWKRTQDPHLANGSTTQQVGWFIGFVLIVAAAAAALVIAVVNLNCFNHNYMHNMNVSHQTRNILRQGWRCDSKSEGTKHDSWAEQAEKFCTPLFQMWEYKQTNISFEYTEICCLVVALINTSHVYSIVNWQRRQFHVSKILPWWTPLYSLNWELYIIFVVPPVLP